MCMYVKNVYRTFNAQINLTYEKNSNHCLLTLGRKDKSLKKWES